MKKIYTTIFLCATTLFAFAQSIVPGALSVQPVSVVGKSGIEPSPMSIDTLWPSVINSPCYTGDATPWTYYYLLAPNTGYLSGNFQLQGTFNSLEIAQRYSGTGTINEVLAWYGYTNGTTGTTMAKIYSVNTSTKKPQTALGTSAAVSVGSIVPMTGFTSYTFTPTVNVTTDFAVSIVLPTNGDSVAIYSTKIGCNTIDSSAYVNLSSAGWYQYNVLLNVKTPNDTAIDMAILPIVNSGSGVNEYPSNNGLTLMGAYPNPASSFTTINYEINEPSAIGIQVFDLSGRVIEKYSDNLKSGKHELKVDVKNLPSGNYYYTIKTDKTQLTSKFSVVK